MYKIRTPRWASLILGLLLVLGLALTLLTPLATAQFEDPDTKDDELDFAFGASCIGIIIVLIVVNLIILSWLYKDAQKRGKGDEAIFWIIAALVGGPIVCLIWLLVRPDLMPEGYPPYAAGPYGMPGKGGIGPGHYPPPPGHYPPPPGYEAYGRGAHHPHDTALGREAYDPGYSDQGPYGHDPGSGEYPPPQRRPPRYPPPE